MIVLCTSSQTRYIIKNDSLVCYSYQENRDIALLLIKGEKDSCLLNNCNVFTDKLKNDFVKLNKDLTRCDSITSSCIEDNRKLFNANQKYKSKFKTYTIIGLASIGLNIILLISLL
jgi:hypothetical protein